MSIRLPKSVFVHVPRTGGLWFGEVLRELGIRHQVLRGDIDSHLALWEMPERWRELPAFAFVRHPVAWLKSRWSHAREINAWDDERHFSVHREFDGLVCETLVQTAERIIQDRPGIVGHTYSFMTSGVRRLYQTEGLPRNGQLALTEFEGRLTIEAIDKIRRHPRMNSTTTMDKYADEIKNFPQSLAREFEASEPVAMTIWRTAL